MADKIDLILKSKWTFEANTDKLIDLLINKHF